MKSLDCTRGYSAATPLLIVNDDFYTWGSLQNLRHGPGTSPPVVIELTLVVVSENISSGFSLAPILLAVLTHQRRVSGSER